MKKSSLACILAAGILWGTSGIFVKLLSPYGFTSLQLTALRGIVSLMCMAVYVLFKDRRLFCARWWELLLFVGIGIGLFGTGVCYFEAMQATSIATAVVLMYTAPVYVMIFSVLFLGEKLSPLKVAAVLCMLLGCCLVAGVVGGLAWDATGILFGVLAGLSYALYNILTKIAMRHGSSPVSATLYSFLTLTVLSLFVCEPQAIGSCFARQPAVTVPLAVAIGLATCFLPYVLYTWGLKEIPAGTASSMAIVEPMAATVFSVCLFGEAVTVFSAAGMVLIMGSVVLLNKAESRALLQQSIHQHGQ